MTAERRAPDLLQKALAETSGKNWRAASRLWSLVAAQTGQANHLVRLLTAQVLAGQFTSAEATLRRLEALGTDTTELRERADRARGARARDAIVRMLAEGSFEAALTELDAYERFAGPSAWVTIRRDGALASCGTFADRLRALPDQPTRIYVCGCGRSGTTLLIDQMACFSRLFVDYAESHAGAFVRAPAGYEAVAIKRSSTAYEFLPGLPTEIGLLYIVRHPYDVMASKLGEKDRYIKPDRWRNEAAALAAVLASGRPNMMLVRYEDLVSDPDGVQARIAQQWGLTIGLPFSRFHEIADTPHAHVARPVDQASIGAWRRHAGLIQDLDAVHAEIGAELEWFARRFGYELRRSG
ncbi:hypothetical protein IHQ68_15965 [Chelatococcus sambhunathii]|uniref:Sulfotransferase family n=1 Tax=Chelatococcus sambhunathii TaxID=363953 RepID=A0ABU1DJ24_9HYPH|nr:hypothetical protein [Chelatococcus sambhunathii]MDR4308116.1 hypothetical protein [Chelatococcus sambhunathii]